MMRFDQIDHDKNGACMLVSLVLRMTHRTQLEPLVITKLGDLLLGQEPSKSTSCRRYSVSTQRSSCTSVMPQLQQRTWITN